jgi:tRNA U34 5-methylaminomethyl-2-thiouridine-forming methyltransferase MnmC
MFGKFFYFYIMTLFLTDDGSHSVISETFGVAYHSKHGAIQETQHVFIEAGLKYALEQNLKEISILDVGFGTGLNAFMTYLEIQNWDVKINYTTLEAYPLPMGQVFQLNYVEKLAAQEFASVFEAMHTLTWEDTHPLSKNFNFTKLLIDFTQVNFENQFDVIYYDAFAPESQPHLWDFNMMQKMYNALKKNSILTTYCAKGSVKRAMKITNLTVEKLVGPPGKREMTRAYKK